MEIEDWIEKNKVSPAIAESQGLLFVVDPAIIDPTLIDIERDKAWGEGHKEAKRESEDELTDLDHKIDRYEKAIKRHKLRALQIPVNPKPLDRDTELWDVLNK